MSAEKNFANFGIGALLAIGAYLLLRRKEATPPANTVTIAGVSAPDTATLPQRDLSGQNVSGNPQPTLLPGGEWSCPSSYEAVLDTSSGNVFCVLRPKIGAIPTPAYFSGVTGGF